MSARTAALLAALLALLPAPAPGGSQPVAPGAGEAADLAELRVRLLSVSDDRTRTLGEWSPRALLGEETTLEGMAEVTTADGLRWGNVRWRASLRPLESLPGALSLEVRSDSSLLEVRGIYTQEVGEVQPRREKILLQEHNDHLFEVHSSAALRSRLILAISFHPLVAGQGDAVIDPSAQVRYRLKTLFREVAGDSEEGGGAVRRAPSGPMEIEETELRSVGSRAALYSLVRTGPASLSGLRPEAAGAGWQERNVSSPIRIEKKKKAPPAPKDPASLTRKQKEKIAIEEARRRAEGVPAEPLPPTREEVEIRIEPVFLGKQEIRLRVRVHGEFFFPGVPFEHSFERSFTEGLRSGDVMQLDLGRMEPRLLELGGVYVFEVTPSW